MFNLDGTKVVIILLVALVVLGPDKLPDAIRRTLRVYGELRRMSAGFQADVREAFDEPLREMRSTIDSARSGFMPVDADPHLGHTPEESSLLQEDPQAEVLEDLPRGTASEPEHGSTRGGGDRRDGEHEHGAEGDDRGR